MGSQVYRKVLLLVSELHVRGYQRIRIAPGMAPSGCYWRCSIAPVTNISDRNGARLADYEGPAVHYSSGAESRYFDWDHCAGLTPSQLATRFVKCFPEIVEAGHGRDWIYVGWYQEMLSLTYPDALPIAYSDWDSAQDRLSTVGGETTITIPMPPPGEGHEREL